VEFPKTCSAFKKCEPGIRRNASQRINDRYFTGLLDERTPVIAVARPPFASVVSRDVSDRLVRVRWFCRNKHGWTSKGDMISNAYLANE
jgi:hypothetical protein